jgi:twitching motility protein PilJ
VSNQIASLVQNISASARSQSVAAQNLARNMQVLREISAQSADSTSATSQAIVKLADLSAALRKSIAGFRLPGATETTGMHRTSSSGANTALAATTAAAAAAATAVAGTAKSPSAGFSSPKIKALGGS